MLQSDKRLVRNLTVAELKQIVKEVVAAELNQPQPENEDTVYLGEDETVLVIVDYGQAEESYYCGWDKFGTERWVEDIGKAAWYTERHLAEKALEAIRFFPHEGDTDIVPAVWKNGRAHSLVKPSPVTKHRKDKR